MPKKTGEHNELQRAEFNAAIANSVYVIRASGTDSGCGLPFSWCCTACKGKAVTCECNRSALPRELVGIMTLEDYVLMVDEIDKAAEETLLPAFPCVLAHICLPCVPFCVTAYCMALRHSRVEAIIAKYNLRVQRGYYWKSAPISNVIHGFAILRSNGAVPVPTVAVAAHGETDMDRLIDSAPEYEMAVVETVAPAAVKEEC